MCGPQAMYNFLDGEIAKLGLRRKFVRRELFGMIKDPWNQPGYPEDIRGKTFNLKVIQCGREYDITASADEPLLTSIERAGIVTPSRCRSGECSWCRSKLVSVRSLSRKDRRPPQSRYRVWLHPSLRVLPYVRHCARRTQQYA